MPFPCWNSFPYTVLTEHFLDAAYRLTDTLLVFDERKAHVFIAVLAETDAGRNRHLRIGQQPLRELERTNGTIGFGNARPNVHRRFRDIDRPTRLMQALGEYIAAALILLHHLCHAVLRAFKGRNGGDLNGCEHAVIVIALDA